ncbi:MAG: helix-turn-helix domain-containing protein [Cyanomargarita calcarea GSE-NOS-MK-12-04C]|jgi:excisionase family DNA binding protein|uniref:Helix-turn-helix domain-containing protein n=1 Tax=Cyanomargarita calcarea GSE-NOS-MK-12-04C TaxID=2839659 RepID=A0A951QTA2_9CYAN|nr:helix-turn-helix domain-containing protein [Cyanomargarita calcarea GSE-NOS-MK-12-04C]
MLEHNSSYKSILPQQLEIQSIKKLESILQATGNTAKLIGPNEEQIAIPESVYQVLRQVVHAFVLGQSISIMPQQQEMTTQEAADFLNVSRPYLIKLLEQGNIPYIKVGSHRRVRFEDLKNYKQLRDTERGRILDELTQESQDMGFYE